MYRNKLQSSSGNEVKKCLVESGKDSWGEAFPKSGAVSTPKCITFDTQTAQLRYPNGPF